MNSSKTVQLENYQEKWDFYQCQVDSMPASIFMDFGFKKVAPIKKLNKACWIELNMNSPREDGLSSSEESEILFSIEDKLIELLNANVNYKFVGRLTNHSKRFFYFYTENNILFEKAVSQCMVQFENYSYEMGSKEDEGWSIYFDFIYPSPQEYQSLMNRRVIDQLEEGGDDLSQQREVDHWIYFKNEKDRDEFKREVLKYGFEIVSESKLEDNKIEPYSLRIKRVDYVDWKSVDNYVLYLWELANKLNGDYDGWETQIISQK